MREGKYIAIVVILAYVVRELWTVLPRVEGIHPFPLSDQEIQLQTYIWAGSIYLFFLIFTFIAFRLSNKLMIFFNAVFIIQALEFIEYLINYNEVWGHIWIMPINITTLRFPVLLVFAIINFLKWKT